MNKIVFWLLSVCSIHAEILQIHQMEECYEHIQPDMLLIFDLDNTIFETVQTLGGDQWFDYQRSEYKKRGYSADEALQVTLAEWVALQNQSQVQLVEPTTAAMIHDWQQKGWKVMALTSRGLYLATRTIDQLRSIGVDFSLAAPSNDWMDSDFLYRNGILFSSGTNKGALLFRFLKKIGMHPQRILFVDDKMRQVQDVEKAGQEHNIPVTGLRYGYLDQKVANFDPQIVAIQMEPFETIISDEEARKRSDNKNQKNAIVGSNKIAPSDPEINR